MPSSRFAIRQRTLGGLAGVILLVFALVYHFFPGLLHVSPQDTPRPVPRTTQSAAPMGFEKRPERKASAADAGPPVALAPREVLERRAQERVAEALAAVTASSGKSATPASPEVVALLERADKAFEEGNLAGDGDSAATLYAQALRAKTDSTRAANGLARVHVQLVMNIEKHLADGEPEEAGHGIDLLKRIPGADEDAKRLGGELESLRKVRPLLAQAADLLRQGKALASKDGDESALAVYREVLAIAPGNSVARESIQHIQGQVLDKALGAVARDDFKAADAALARATQILPGSEALQDTRGRIEGIRRQRAASILAQARTALDSGDLELAGKLKQQALAVSSDIQGLDEFNHQMSNARLYANYQPSQVFSDRFLDIKGRGPAMVVIATGSFLMGSSDSDPDHQANESPQHMVHIKRGFAIGRSEVTVGQFREFVRASGYVPDSVRLGGASVYDSRSGVMRDDEHATWEDDYAGRRAQDAMPVVNVSWNDAHAYVQWLSKRTGREYRLPSEAQFAYALRAGTKTPYWWGDGTPSKKVENVTGSGDRSHTGRRWTHAFSGYRDGYWGPAPIQSFAPNPFGLYDMGGNVTEWVRDCWHDNYTRAPDDGSAWVNPGCVTRVLRGGSWGSAPDQVRSAWRQGAAAATRSGRVGFRVARKL